MRIDRRNEIYNGIANSDYTNFNLTYHMLGTPYPVVETAPTFYDAARGLRWYEHGISVAAGFTYHYWLSSKASMRYARTVTVTKATIGFGTFVLCELMFLYRSVFRLSGYMPNDYECRKFGVLETKERLEQKKALWEKYATYKKEWCRRFDYHVYGIRPGENFNLFSACWIPAWEPSFGKQTDYPLRKNPYFLTTAPLRTAFRDNGGRYYQTRDGEVPSIKARPEMKYLYQGPLKQE
ncbi:hypothetical protein AGDE_00657 [Angomonas deanei]|nr:hypothetical protein AGDE_04007 [Angomonas deanei]EPY43265.1 hypothetical protein AGDE_00657 [Angomonas deanei]|eukprot:EPY39921.1 hypothetical protein AGDE_04007 [Angomonas deanei]